MKDSTEFAEQLFDALARREGLVDRDYISVTEFERFWLHLSDTNFDSRLQIFFDMCDKNGDGRISEEEVKEVIAGAIVIGVMMHALFHLTCDFPRIEHCPLPKFINHLEPAFHYKKPSYGDLVTSVVGITGVLLVIFMAFSFNLATHQFRRNVGGLPGVLKRIAGFNAFWYSHHLFVLVYILLIIHSLFLFLTDKWYQKTTWMYLSIPLLIYASECVVRVMRSSLNHTVNVVKAAIYPGDVLAIYMTKPPTFKYKSGMYMFVKCLDISPFEWHPFSITSAPNDEFLSVHIRAVGDWTSEMKRRFSKVCSPPPAGKSGFLRADQLTTPEGITRFPRLLIDGPYGAPAQKYMIFCC